MQKRFVEIGVEELDWPQSPDLNPIEYLWDELECRQKTWPNCPTSVHVAEWKQVPAAMFQKLAENLPKRVETVMATRGDQPPY